MLSLTRRRRPGRTWLESGSDYSAGLWTHERSDRADAAGTIPLWRELIETQRRLRRDPRWLVQSLVGLSMALSRTGQHAEAETVAREAVGLRRNDGTMANLGLCLLRRKKWAEAEPLLRESLDIRARERPDSWLRYNAMSLLGESLAGQKRHAEAQPLLVEGHEKMEPPPDLAFRKREALDRVIALYEAWGKPGKAAAWRKKAAGR